MPLCDKCTEFFENVIFDFGVAGVTDDYLHHGHLQDFLAAVDDKCFICWRIFSNSFLHPLRARRLLGKIAKATSSKRKQAERQWLSLQRLHVTSIWAGSTLAHDRFWAEWNKDFLESLKISHPDLKWLRQDIQEVESLIKETGEDENGRKAGSFLFVPRESHGGYCSAKL